MQNSLNLVTLIAALQKQWKIIIGFVMVTGIVTTVTVFLVPQYYRSSATIVSANPMLADKARLFNTQIQSLYSYFGNGDDLDRIYGIADLDTTYKALVDEFSLVSYYQLVDDSLPILKQKALLQLRKDLLLQKTEQGQLKIIAWTKDKQLSSKLVNRMVAILQETESGIWQKNYSRSITAILSAITSMQNEYTALADRLATANVVQHELIVAQMQTLLEQIKQYKKTNDEFKLALANSPNALYVMESATPASKAERPDKPAVILISLLIAFVFSCFLVLVNDRKNIA
jgi:uncharacterized protein involved in exopolysaccharide biosynthesis